jgi:HK97 family phage portal protein
VSLLGRALRGTERRSSGLLTPPSWLTESLGGSASYSGRSVTPESSLQLVAVWSAVNLLAGAVGSMPLVVYKRLEQGRERATGHWMWPLLHDQPNPAMSSNEFWRIMAAHYYLWGNAYAAKIRGTLGGMQGGELWPIRPSRVTVGLDENGDRYYLLDGKPERYTDRDIFHIRATSIDGITGMSVIQQARQALGVIGDIEEFTGRFYGQGAVNSVVLKHPKTLSATGQDNLARSFKRKLGPGGAGEPIVLEEDMDYGTITMPLADAQFIETRKMALLDVALMFRVPPKMLGAATGDSLTYTSSEWESLDFVRWSLTPTLTQFEGALLRDPSMFIQGRRFYPEFLVDSILRGTAKERAEVYQIALDPTKGWMDRSEVRDRENLGPDPTQQPVPNPEANPAVTA